MIRKIDKQKNELIERSTKLVKNKKNKIIDISGIHSFIGSEYNRKPNTCDVDE